MQATLNIHSDQASSLPLESRIGSFFKQFEIGALAHRCQIRKQKGVSPLALLSGIFSLAFSGQNIFRGIVTNRKAGLGKDTTYDFLRSHSFSWRRFLLLLALKVCAVIDSLTGTDRETVLVLDDTTIHRPRSRKVELLAKVYDHCEGKFLKGFRALTLCWSDGASLLPLDFALLSSASQKNRYQEATKVLDKRSCGYKRRAEATTKSTDLIEPMLQRALKAGLKARYLLMDSWFAMPCSSPRSASTCPSSA